MKHLLNTLYITTQGSYLAREGETVLVRVEQETKLQLPIHTIGSLFVSGRFLAVLFAWFMCRASCQRIFPQC